MTEQRPTNRSNDRDRELLRLHEDFIDSWDEELEMEMDDDRFGVSRGVEGGSMLPGASTSESFSVFRESW